MNGEQSQIEVDVDEMLRVVTLQREAALTEVVRMAGAMGAMRRRIAELEKYAPPPEPAPE